MRAVIFFTSLACLCGLIVWGGCELIARLP
jgi:hypothetical protein